MGLWSWVIAGVSLIGTVANVKGERWCYLIWGATNAVWIWLDYRSGLHGQAALFAVQTGLCVWGWLEWGKKGESA